MKTINALSLVLVLGLVTVATAEQRVNERVEADRNGEVDIENIAGRVQVEGWSEKAVEVTGVMGDDLELQLERKGPRTMVTVKYPQRRGTNHQYADILVRVPVASRVSIETVSADIEGRSLSGPLEVESVSGSIEMDVQSREIDAESVSGDIELHAVKAEVELSAVSGDIEIRLQEGEIDVETVSGDIEIMADRLLGGDAQSVSGDLDVNAGLGQGCRLDLEAHSGDVDLALPADTSAEIDLEAYSGSIRNRLGGEQTGGDAKRELNLRFGTGDARVEVTTFSGDIVLLAR